MNKKMDKQIIIYSYYRNCSTIKLNELRYMQPQNCILDESQKYYIDCKKSDTQKYILYDTIYKSLKSKVRNQSSGLPIRGRDWWSWGRGRCSEGMSWELEMFLINVSWLYGEHKSICIYQNLLSCALKICECNTVKQLSFN